MITITLLQGAKLPTDHEILDAIYVKYYDAFAATAGSDQGRSAYLPIDILELAKQFHVDPDIIFGRLYFHLNNKYQYQNAKLFAVSAGSKTNSINFPYLSSILADMRDQDSKHRWSLTLSIVANVISGLSFVVALVALIAALLNKGSG